MSDEIVTTVCSSCCDENFNWKGLYEFKLCFRHAPKIDGSEDILATARANFVNAESEGETNRAWSKWACELRRERNERKRKHPQVDEQ